MYVNKDKESVRITVLFRLSLSFIIEKMQESSTSDMVEEIYVTAEGSE